jgi:16S rRNA A1518/A1519 N6-dimethyltransferase RsmA/KsgA/DIM1 with predicted DNA glycosylase/AP lyase activity
METFSKDKRILANLPYNILTKLKWKVYQTQEYLTYGKLYSTVCKQCNLSLG